MLPSRFGSLSSRTHNRDLRNLAVPWKLVCNSFRTLLIHVRRVGSQLDVEEREISSRGRRKAISERGRGKGELTKEKTSSKRVSVLRPFEWDLREDGGEHERKVMKEMLRQRARSIASFVGEMKEISEG